MTLNQKNTQQNNIKETQNDHIMMEPHLDPNEQN